MGLVAIPAMWFPMKVYQKKRVFEFLDVSERKLLLKTLRQSEKEKLARIIDPRSDKPVEELLDSFGGGWNSEQSKIAVGSGGFYGRGFLSGSQTQLAFLPEAHTDFIFAVLAEEFGLGGVIVVLALFLLLVTRIMVIGVMAHRLDKPFSGFLAYGVGIWIGLQALVSVGVNLGVLPTKGLTLPLISSGGSSMLMTLLALGLVLRIKYEMDRSNGVQHIRKKVMRGASE